MLETGTHPDTLEAFRDSARALLTAAGGARALRRWRSECSGFDRARCPAGDLRSALLSQLQAGERVLGLAWQELPGQIEVESAATRWHDVHGRHGPVG